MSISPLLMITLLFGFCTPALSTEDISLDRLMLLHDIFPEKSLRIDNRLSLPEKVAEQSKPNIATHLNPHTPTPYRVLIDVRSNHSDGVHDFDTLISLAEKRHLDAIAFTEHDRYSIRLGIDPVPHIFGYSQEHPSLYQTGVDNFFADLKRIQQQSNITVFAGTESTPGYYWQGIPFKNLSLHDAEKHLITLGVKTPENITQLSSYSLEYGYGNKELSLVFWFVFIFGLIFILMRKKKRIIALLLAGSFIAFMTTWLMKPKIDPNQAFIKSAHEQNLFVIWTHPGTKSGVRQGPMGVLLDTPPYNRDVFQSSTADAFAATYGDNDNNTVAGGLWDQYMMDYLAGYIGKPIWAVAAGDYHKEGQSGEFLGNFPMDVWAKSAQEDDILAALKQGRMTAWQMGKQHNLSLNSLALLYTNPETQETETMFIGDTAVVSANVTLIASLKEMDNTKTPMQLKAQWIVDGQIVGHILLSSDMQVAQSYPLHLSAGRHVIRLQIPAQQGVRMEANPFLVQVRE
ncbi:MAG: hypothetical protein Q9M46_06320 [Ghiorsea sp.]|nr:hypothetical protein [Ghiorsea sp.]